MQFGGCYLGKHLDRIAQIQRRTVEVELLTATIEQHLKVPMTGGVSLSDDQRQATVPHLVREFHQDSSFKTGENGELIAALESEVVWEAARRLLQSAPSS
jgi:hypothetical protein